MSFDSTVISRVQKVGSIVPLESRIYAVWFLNIEGGNILYNSELFNSILQKFMVDKSGVEMFMALNSGVESPGLKHWVEKFDVEMSFNPLYVSYISVSFIAVGA